MTAQSKMKAQVVLRKIAFSAEHFAKLRQVSGRHMHSRVQRKLITLGSFQLKADPVIFRAALRPEDHRLADEILDNRFHSAVVEQITYSEPSAHLRHLERRPHTTTDVLECAIVLVQQQQLRFLE